MDEFTCRIWLMSCALRCNPYIIGPYPAVTLIIRRALSVLNRCRIVLRTLVVNFSYEVIKIISMCVDNNDKSTQNLLICQPLGRVAVYKVNYMQTN